MFLKKNPHRLYFENFKIVDVGYELDQCLLFGKKKTIHPDVFELLSEFDNIGTIKACAGVEAEDRLVDELFTKVLSHVKSSHLLKNLYLYSQS